MSSHRCRPKQHVWYCNGQVQSGNVFKRLWKCARCPATKESRIR